MSESADNLSEQLAAYQKIWMDTFSSMMQTAFAGPLDSAPPEMLRQMRSGIFQALAKSWDEYLRSPQFAEGMKQWMDSAIMYRKMTNELLTRSHHETQGVAREDVDSVLVAVRHLEKRLLDRIEELEARMDQRKGSAPSRTAAKATAGSSTTALNGVRSRSRRNARSKATKETTSTQKA